MALIGTEIIYFLYSHLLRPGRSGDRIVVGARFSASIHTGPGSHPASYTMGTGFFPGVKRPGRDFDHPPTSSADIKERVELYIYSTSGSVFPVLGWNWILLLKYSTTLLKTWKISCPGGFYAVIWWIWSPCVLLLLPSEMISLRDEGSFPFFSVLTFKSRSAIFLQVRANMDIPARVAIAIEWGLYLWNWNLKLLKLLQIVNAD
jgi:hypothetical protein